MIDYPYLHTYVELVFILQIPFVYEKINLYFIEISILNT